MEVYLTNTGSVTRMNAENREDDARNRGSAASHSAQDRSISLTNNRVDSRALFGGVREITIVHGDDSYRLRLTAQNKLILTK